jgi:hypothetical protein
MAYLSKQPDSLKPSVPDRHTTILAFLHNLREAHWLEKI